jgi:lysophospholipase L1-like esterase
MYRIADAVTSRDFTPQSDEFDFVPRGEALPTYFRNSFELLKSIDFNKVDIATIAYGTNDFTAARPLEGAGKYDVTSYGGALRYSIEKLRWNFPNLTLVLCSQTYRFWRDKDTGEVIGDSNDRPMESGLYLPEFVKKTEEIAAEYGLFFIDNYNGPVINEANRDLCFSGADGAHPIPYGRRLIAENISKNLIERFG